MNRELKFRVWDSRSEPEMIYIDDFYWFEENYVHSFCEGAETDCLVFQQYTGLKDKNGREIYEGDIVKYARTRIETIEYPKNMFNAKLIELGEDIGEIAFMGFEFVVSFDYKRYDDIEKLGNYPHRFEVIGNIHENPELLK